MGLILEELIKTRDEGIVKTDLYNLVGLKTPIGEKYLNQLLSANYISLEKQRWGEVRERHIIKVTEKGRERYQWIIQLSNELKGD